MAKYKDLDLRLINGEITKEEHAEMAQYLTSEKRARTRQATLRRSLGMMNLCGALMVLFAVVIAGLPDIFTGDSAFSFAVGVFGLGLLLGILILSTTLHNAWIGMLTVIASLIPPFIIVVIYLLNRDARRLLISPPPLPRSRH